MKHWYDGYVFEDFQVYNPRAVVSLMLNGYSRILFIWDIWGYDQNTQSAFVPNEEIRIELNDAVEILGWSI